MVALFKLRQKLSKYRNRINIHLKKIRDEPTLHRWFNPIWMAIGFAETVVSFGLYTQQNHYLKCMQKNKDLRCIRLLYAIYIIHQVKARGIFCDTQLSTRSSST